MASPVDIELAGKALQAVCEEMGIVLQRSAFSPNIKERRDFSCALFDGEGRLLAQAAHIPVHLGAMPDTVAEVRSRFRLRPGDIVITNDPFKGGTHLPDVTLVKGVFLDGESGPAYYLVARAHHADVGGATPGSMPLATRLEDEGVLIEPALLMEEGKPNRALLEDILSKVRRPEERKGDLAAQAAALKRGEERLLETLAREGPGRLISLQEALLDYGERVMRDLISEIPNGEYAFEDALDDDGLGSGPVPIRVRVRIRDEVAEVDLSESGGQLKTGLNTVRSVTRSSVYYVFFALVGEGYPCNAGSLRPIRVVTRPGTLVDAMPPAPVAAGNVETSQRIVDALLGALAEALPGRIPAASSGSMNNVAIGGRNGEFAYYETLAGGMGGRPGLPGLSGVHTHMTNTLNTPVEALEQAYPLRVEYYRIRRGSGGNGRFPGGDGLVRAYRFLAPAVVTVLSERRRLAPYGLKGGSPGKKGLNRIRRSGAGGWRLLPGKFTLEALPGDLLEIRTPGGGGWGSLTSEGLRKKYRESMRKDERP